MTTPPPDKPKKKFGQHFLHDQSVLSRIAQSCRIEEGDTVVEIGAGKGQLTTLLASLGERIIAVEKDRDLIPELEHACAAFKNVAIIQDDVLRVDPANLGIAPGYILAGNIPYYITGKIIELALEQWPKPKQIVFTVQKEVALRICAKPGSLSILGVLTQALAIPRVIAQISKTAFWPAPKVDSAVLELIPRELPAEFDKDAFKQAVKSGFSHPRKLCASNLSIAYGTERKKIEQIFAQCGVNPSVRSQDISVSQWIEISTLLKPLSA